MAPDIVAKLFAWLDKGRARSNDPLRALSFHYHCGCPVRFALAASRFLMMTDYFIDYETQKFLAKFWV